MKKLIFAFALTLFTFTVFGQKAVHISKKGTGNPILFLPGFTTPGSVWDETIQHLSGPYESHVASYAGFNGLVPIGTPWYTPIRDQLIDYVRKEGLSNLTIIGHSMGGNLAVDLAFALKDQVAQLILVESIPCMRELMMPGVPAENLRYNSPYNQRVLQMSDSAFRQMATGIAQYMSLDTSKVEMITNWSLNADRKTYVYGYTDLLKLDLRDKLKDISARTLILGAPFPGKTMVQANYEKQYANLGAKKILIAENSMHFLMFDQPEWLYDNINDFLSENGQN